MEVLNLFREKPDLKLAQKSASEVYKTLRKVPGTSADDRLIMDLSAVVLEAIECIEMNTAMTTSSFDRIARYASLDSKVPILKLGYSLKILLEKLLTDRYAAASSGQHVQAFNGNAADEEEEVTAGTAHFINTNQPKEIKEELGDVKVEEPDDYEEVVFVAPIDDVKLEVPNEEVMQEEPIIDVYCPASGSSRPLDRLSPYEMSSDKQGNAECDLCDDPRHPYVTSPKNAISARSFFNNLIVVDPKEREKIAWYLINAKKRATICSKHVRRGDIGKPATGTSRTTFKMILEKESRKRGIPHEDLGEIANKRARSMYKDYQRRLN